MNKELIFKRLVFSILVLLTSTRVSAQINMQDSTVQVVGYWETGDTQSFDISFDKFKIKEQDTISAETIKYVVDISIKDASADSYTIEWFYKDYEVESENKILKKVMKAADDLAVVMKMDEFGAFQEILNWEEVRDHINKATKTIEKQFKKIPEAQQMVSQVMSIYASKEAIEANAIKDALQFYTFHGGAYLLHEELKGQLQVANNYGEKPFDTDVTVSLDEIDEEGGTSVFRMYQEINSQQLTNATYDFLKSLGKLGDQLPPREEFPPLTNQIWTASRVHSATGWTTYSIETKEIKAEGTTNIEERIIQIK